VSTLGTRCSFCRRLKSQVRFIVGAETGPTICNECVVKADGVMRDATMEARITSITEPLQQELARTQEQLRKLQADLAVATTVELRQYISQLERVVDAVRQAPLGSNAASIKAVDALEEWKRARPPSPKQDQAQAPPKP
jgi:hypothetical protein